MAGLYAGITFSKGGADSASPPAPVSQSAPSTAPSTATAATAEQLDIERQRQAALEDAARYAAQQAELQAKEAAENARKAALGFQPVVRKRPQPAKARLPGAAVIAAGPSSMTSTSSSTAATIAAPPSLINEASSHASSSSSVHQSQAAASSSTTGRTLPPPMTLDDTEDVNGFRSTQAGKKANNKSKNKKKRGGAGRRDEDPSMAWTAEYDPARPTDYSEYKAYSKRARSERRAAMLREKQMEKRRKGMQSEGSDYSNEDDYTDEDEDDSDAERRRRIAKANNRFFAPPASYEDASPAPQPAVSEDPEPASYRPTSTETGGAPEDPPSAPQEAKEDAWAAWSAAPAETSDPFARRAALSQHASRPQAQPPTRMDPVQRQPSPLAPPHRTASPSPFPPPSAFVSAAQASAPSPSYAPPNQGFPLPPHMMPPTGSQSPQPFIPAAPSPAAEPRPDNVPPVKVPVAIEEAQARARAIAARLASMGKFGGGGAAKPAGSEEQTPAPSSMSPLSMPPIPNADEPIPGLGPVPAAPSQTSASGPPKETSKPEDFAKNLMAKYGWTKGQGLGATNQGMLNPLALAGGDDSHKQGKKKEQHNTSQSKAGPVGIATAKGRIVSDLKTEREQAEREKFGEPTRVVCLTNMVGRDEVDDELVSDVCESSPISFSVSLVILSDALL